MPSNQKTKCVLRSFESPFEQLLKLSHLVALEIHQYVHSLANCKLCALNVESYYIAKWIIVLDQLEFWRNFSFILNIDIVELLVIYKNVTDRKDISRKKCLRAQSFSFKVKRESLVGTGYITKGLMLVFKSWSRLKWNRNWHLAVRPNCSRNWLDLKNFVFKYKVIFVNCLSNCFILSLKKHLRLFPFFYHHVFFIFSRERIMTLFLDILLEIQSFIDQDFLLTLFSLKIIKKQIFFIKFFLLWWECPPLKIDFDTALIDYLERLSVFQSDVSLFHFNMILAQKNISVDCISF